MPGFFTHLSVRRLGIASLVAMVGLLCACQGNNNSGTTTTGGSLAQVELGAPSSPVMNNMPFNVDVHANNLGFSVLHHAGVHLVFPSPLLVDSAEVTSGGGTVTVVNGVSGTTVDYNFGTIEKSAQSAGTVHARGVLLPTQNNVTATVTAELTSDEVHAGDADAHVDVIVQQ